MSASFFATILTCDARTAPDNRGMEVAVGGSQQPRWIDQWGPEGRRAATNPEHPWAQVHPHAETVLQVVAQTINDTPMDGISGDHPDKRLHAVVILDAVADMVRLMALDADGNSTLTDEQWQEALRALSNKVAMPFPESDARRRTSLTVLDANQS